MPVRLGDGGAAGTSTCLICAGLQAPGALQVYAAITGSSHQSTINANGAEEPLTGHLILSAKEDTGLGAPPRQGWTTQLA